MSNILNTENNEKMPIRGPFMAFDVGTKRLGVAFAPKGALVISPKETYKRVKFSLDAPYLIKMLIEWDIRTLVVGLPLNMDGTEGAMCQSVRDFVTNLQNFDGWPSNIAVFFQDERLTSEISEETLIKDLDLSRAKRKGAIDQMAATEILKRFLEENNLLT
ncbi:MAG: Holliday junction resolvase RuvX [Rickettsiales bacterium]|nr:Holliday junction resolvase RuvX [Rickettsiales bacterium]|tara:strand:+ start:534 stop:1016 length:483 start_codon:yes stop_codon:yes gene_type:complete